MRRSLKTAFYARIGLIFAFLQVFLPHMSFAESMSSTNYRVQADVLGIGGGHSTSTNYIANDTLGEIATGEDLSSTNYLGCAGFQCFGATTPSITFSVKQGTSSPGTAGVGVALGTLDTATVTTSNGTTVNSIFLTMESNGTGGSAVSVRDLHAGLKRTSTADLIDSASTTLVAGTEGYGLCVFSATESGGSPTALTEAAPFNGTCTKTTGHQVGIVTATKQNILTTTGAVTGGTSEILVKAAISPATAAGTDYADTLTFIYSATF